MKLRIRDNTLRFRLGKKEVQLLFENGSISSEVKLGISPNSTFTYVLEHASVEARHLDFIQGKITCVIPTAEIEKWVQSEQVGIYHSIEIEEGYVLELVLEKDFKCLIERIDDDDDGFHNPQSVSLDQSEVDGQG